MELTKTLIINLYNKRKGRAELTRKLEQAQLHPIKLPINDTSFDPKQVDNVLIYNQNIADTKKQIVDIDASINAIEGTLTKYYDEAGLTSEMRIRVEHDGDIYISTYNSAKKILVEKVS